jgi:hypothetical protein
MLFSYDSETSYTRSIKKCNTFIYIYIYIYSREENRLHLSFDNYKYNMMHTVAYKEIVFIMG